MKLNLKIARMKKGYKQQELAEMIGVSRYYLSSLETGKIKYPSGKIMLKISKALDTPIQELFFNEEE